MNKKNNRKGFTTVELVIVIAVIAILATVMIPTFSSLINKANESSRDQTAAAARTAIMNNALMPDKDDTAIKESDTIYIVISEDGDAYFYSMTIKNNTPVDVAEDNKPDVSDTTAFKEITSEIEDLPADVKVYVAITADDDDT